MIDHGNIVGAEPQVEGAMPPTSHYVKWDKVLCDQQCYGPHPIPTLTLPTRRDNTEHITFMLITSPSQTVVTTIQSYTLATLHRHYETLKR